MPFSTPVSGRTDRFLLRLMIVLLAINTLIAVVNYWRVTRNRTRIDALEDIARKLVNQPTVKSVEP